MSRALRWTVRTLCAAAGWYGEHRRCTWPNQTHTPLNEDDQ